MSFVAFDPARIDRIVENLSAMLQRRSIARELQALRQLAVVPEQIDETVLAAINVSFNLDDDSLVAETSDIGIDFAPIQSTAARAA
jgi:hypothetical protein